MFICGSEDGVLKDFLKLKENERNQLKLLIGHVDYGIHKNFKEDSKYITFLRDPIERVLSHLSMSVAALTKKMGWYDVKIQAKNVNKHKPDIQLISKAHLDIIHQYNSLDIKFYKLIQEQVFFK